MSLIVDDEYIIECGKIAQELSSKLYWIIDGYKDSLTSIIENGIKEGVTSDSLKEFKIQVESDTGKNSSTAFLIGDEMHRYCEGFIMKVDKDDKDLYWGD